MKRIREGGLYVDGKKVTGKQPVKDEKKDKQAKKPEVKDAS